MVVIAHMSSEQRACTQMERNCYAYSSETYSSHMYPKQCQYRVAVTTYARISGQTVYVSMHINVREIALIFSSNPARFCLTSEKYDQIMVRRDDTQR